MMRSFTLLFRPFGRSLGHRIAVQLIAIGCLFMLICLHLQYEFANKSSSAARSHRQPPKRRMYDNHLPIDDDNILWYGEGSKDRRQSSERLRRTANDEDDDNELLYIDINDEQRNAERQDRVLNHALDSNLIGGVNSGGSTGNLAGVGQYQMGRKALLSKRISSVGDEYPAVAESDERSFAGLPLQPWASRDHSIASETRRFFQYITTKQVQCREEQAVGRNNPAGTGNDWPWMVCFDEGSSFDSRGALRPGCIVYSFGARSSDIKFEMEMAERGCEVHIFDPSGRVRAQVSSAAKPTALHNVMFHKTTLDWRDSNLDSHGSSPWKPRKLSAIMAKLGHDTIDIVRADLQSAEWKVLESILLDGTVSRIHQLLFNVHLNWSGFEVQGSNDDVIRFWYSVLKQLQVANFRLFHTWEDRSEPAIFLGQTLPDISSTYTLGWVNKAWR
ncbi:probable methyltransferase-like protein 24 [Diadema setosum]|uniref:probable methyltransferase-like protein 24 n=1 Tax=Diadema setosum TaxID=31175 RepID=UPI003B3A4411